MAKRRVKTASKRRTTVSKAKSRARPSKRSKANQDDPVITAVVLLVILIAIVAAYLYQQNKKTSLLTPSPPIAMIAAT